MLYKKKMCKSWNSMYSTENTVNNLYGKRWNQTYCGDPFVMYKNIKSL